MARQKLCVPGEVTLGGSQGAIGGSLSRRSIRTPDMSPLVGTWRRCSKTNSMNSHTGRAGIAKLQAFGVIFGTDRVVIYVEPDSAHRPVVANTARTQLLIEGETLDWTGWAAEFREHMPGGISAPAGRNWGAGWGKGSP
jgi:hypothetical protein